MEGVLILVVPFERLHDCTDIRSSHFASLNVLRMADPDSVEYRQVAIFGLLRGVRGAAVKNNEGLPCLARSRETLKRIRC